METLIADKKKLLQIENSMAQFQKRYEEQINNIINSIYAIMCETKFFMARMPNGTKEYYYTSSISNSSNHKINGIKISTYNNVPECGEISIKHLLDAKEYQSIDACLFFNYIKRKKIIIDSSNRIAKECKQYEPYDNDIIFEKGIPSVAYCRLSQGNSKNAYNRQINSIKKSAGYDFSIESVFSETISGAINLKDRIEVNAMIRFCKINGIKTMFVSELDRIGRTKSVIMNGISFLRKNGIEEIHVIKEGIIINEKYLASNYRKLISIAKKCEDDRNNIIYRISNGRDAYLEKMKSDNSLKLGRPYGYRKTKESYEKQYATEINLLKDGLSLRQIVSMTGTSCNTLQRIKKICLIEK